MFAILAGYLPVKVQPYAKFVVASVAAVLVVASESGLPFVQSHYFAEAVVVLGALGVKAAPNKPLS